MMKEHTGNVSLVISKWPYMTATSKQQTTLLKAHLRAGGGQPSRVIVVSLPVLERGRLPIDVALSLPASRSQTQKLA
eukprot:6177452-Pleurochrysis_carterae.AAC.2